MLRHLPTQLPGRQKGATLVVALLVLVLIMMIGVASVTTSGTQFTLAGNLQFEDNAINHAETAVQTGESWLRTNALNTAANGGFTTSSNGYYSLPVAGAQVLVDPLTVDWTSNSSTVSVNANQRYYIQMLSLNSSLMGSGQGVGSRVNSVCSKVNTYLVAGRGVSARGASKIIQSYYSVLSC
jgi:Tfp pilus assembly protein PilX